MTTHSPSSTAFCRIGLAVVIWTGGFAPLTAQKHGPEELTLDRLLARYDEFVPQLPEFQWLPGAPVVLEINRDPKRGPVAVTRSTMPNNQREVWFGPEELRAALAEAGAELPEGAGLPALGVVDDRTVRFPAAGALWHWRPSGSTPPERVLLLPENAEATEIAPGDGAVAWSSGGDVWVRDREGRTRRITWDGVPEDVVHGLAAHRREFGIQKGLFWSGDGRRLAFYREDLRGVAPYPYVDYSVQPARPVHGRYPMSGRTQSKVRIGVHDLGTGRLVWLEGDPDADLYWTNPTFSPDGAKIYVALVNRGQDHLELAEFDATTGTRLRTVLEETDSAWVEPEHGPIFPPDGDGLLWFSERGGYRQLWRVGDDGSFRYPETDLRCDVDEFVGFVDKGQAALVMAAGADPLQRHLFRVRLGPPQPAMMLNADPRPKMEQWTPSIGFHECIAREDGWVIDTWSQLYHPGLAQVRAPGSGRTFLQQVADPFGVYPRLTHRTFQTVADDGSVLHGHFILPPNPDPLRKHPVLLYVYGGPHSQLVQQRFHGGASPWLYWMAMQGYVVVRLDNRGTSRRGAAFARAVHRNLGELEVIDQLAGLMQLAQDAPAADLERVGVHGWSYGGYMTLRLMGLAPDQFQVGVSGNPVTDWSRYETGYGERYMDTPAENPEGYEASSILPLADSLTAPLLLIHGSDDKTVMGSNTYALLEACIEAGTAPDLAVYPMQQHGLRGKAREHFLRRMTAYFLEHLPPPEPLPSLGAIR